MAYPPFKPLGNLFGDQPEMGLTPDDFFSLRMQQPQWDTGPAFNPSLDSSGYNPQHVMSDKLMALLDQMPQREKPSFSRKLLGGLAGLGADSPSEQLRVTEQVTNKPYHQKLEDWKNKIGLTEKGAELENRRNVNDRMFAGVTSQANKRAADIERDKSRLEIDKEKSDRIYETKISDLERKSNDAASKLDLAEKALAQKGATADSDRELRKAQLDALNARHQLDVAQRDRQLAEQKRLHDDMATKWEAEKKDREARIAQYEKQLGINQQNADNRTGSDKTVTKETKDASGKVTGSVTTTIKSGKAKTGLIHVKAPDGRTGTWDLSKGPIPEGFMEIK